jgi:hypothetical protein
MAACALPGVMPAVLPGTACAEEAPTEGLVALKFSHYQDSQAGYYGGNTGSTATSGNGLSTAAGLNTSGRAVALGLGHGVATISSASSSGGSGSAGGLGSDNNYRRIEVNTPSVYALVPFNTHWAAEGSLTVDDISGASPQYYTDMRGAAHMVDKRKAGDAKLTYYTDRQSYALGLAHSKESDFISNAVSAEARLASADQNTTWNLGLGITQDRIDPITHIVSNEKRHTTEVQLGVTQVLSQNDLVQANFTLSRANGYLSDPYKLDDSRPRSRNADILQLRWNHWLGGSALKLGYRLYKDSYGILAHTADAALAVPLGSLFTVTPALRYYTQTAANFYADPNPSTYPGPAGSPTYFSADQRVAAFGALSGSLKLAWHVQRDWTVDAKFEYYRQATSLAMGTGSPGLNPLIASTWQLGLSHTF